MQSSNSDTRRLAQIAMLTALALIIWIAEEFMPRPMPWLKYGFSYVVVIVAMEKIGIASGIIIAFLRVFLGSLILGRIFSPAFVLSFAGTAAAIIVMCALFPMRRKLVSFVGISVAGAFAHIAAQIVVAGALFYRPDAVIWLLPPMTLWAIIAGAAVGIIATIIGRAKILRFAGAGE